MAGGRAGVPDPRRQLRPRRALEHTRTLYFFRKSALRCDAISFRRDVLSLLKCALRCTLRFADTLVLYFILRETVGPDTRGAGRPASEGPLPFFLA